MPTLLAPGPADMAALLALNNAHARETSLLDRDGLSALVAAAWRVRMTPDTDGLCIALDQAAAYDNPNFAWFKTRHARFVYVDRIIVAEAARGQGLARAFYEDLFDAMRADDQRVLCCEINREPPNPGSDRFHAALGFKEVGEARLVDRGKTVRYLERRISSRPVPEHPVPNGKRRRFQS